MQCSGQAQAHVQFGPHPTQLTYARSGHIHDPLDWSPTLPSVVLPTECGRLCALSHRTVAATCPVGSSSEGAAWSASKIAAAPARPLVERRLATTAAPRTPPHGELLQCSAARPPLRRRRRGQALHLGKIVSPGPGQHMGLSRPSWMWVWTLDPDRIAGIAG